MKKTTLFIGLNDKNTKHQEIATLDAYKIAVNIFTAYTGGATISEAVGIYTHDNGETVTEKTLRCEVYSSDIDAIRTAANALKRAFNQESILIETVETESAFI